MVDSSRVAGSPRRVPASKAVGVEAPPGHQLRTAGPADAPALAELLVASRRAAMPWLPVLHDLETTVAYVRDAVVTRTEVWVEVGAGGALIGFIAFGDGEVEHLYVAPGFQGRGTGSRLLRLAQARGEPLELWAFRRNERALAFYRRHGFRSVRETDGANNEEREPDVRLRWEPPAAGSAGKGDGAGR